MHFRDTLTVLGAGAPLPVKRLGVRHVLLFGLPCSRVLDSTEAVAPLAFSHSNVGMEAGLLRAYGAGNT